LAMMLDTWALTVSSPILRVRATWRLVGGEDALRDSVYNIPGC